MVLIKQDTILSPAKINLFLKVIKKQSNGLHRQPVALPTIRPRLCGSCRGAAPSARHRRIPPLRAVGSVLLLLGRERAARGQPGIDL